MSHIGPTGWTRRLFSMSRLHWLSNAGCMSLLPVLSPPPVFTDFNKKISIPRKNGRVQWLNSNARDAGEVWEDVLSQTEAEPLISVLSPLPHRGVAQSHTHTLKTA